jgi:HAD superfamily hydrolase (TIGR01509 family)
MRPDLVIFDMDGLMFDTETVSYSAWKQAGNKYGYDINKDIFMKILGTNIEYIKNIYRENFGEDFPLEEIINERNLLAEKIVDDNGLRVKDGLYQLLEHLKKLNIKRAVATSTSRERAMKLLQLAEIDKSFDYIICGDEVTKSKPEPEIFLKVAEKLGCSPEKSVVLEDSRWGIQAAKNAGMIPIMVPDMLEPDEEILNLIYKKVNSLHDIREIIY